MGVKKKNNPGISDLKDILNLEIHAETLIMIFFYYIL